MITESTNIMKIEGKLKQWIIAFIVCITLFTYGLQSGWMSPTVELLRSSKNPQGYPFSVVWISWIASGLCFGAMATTLLYTYIADEFGRKPAIILIAVFQALAWIIKLISAHPVSLMTARLMSGIASGGLFNVVPIYLKEISDDTIRGAVGTTVMLFQGFGNIAMYTMGGYLDYYAILWIVVGIPIVNGFLFLLIPESPVFLIKKNKIEEALKVLASLQGVNKKSTNVLNDISKMKNDAEKYRELPNITIKEILNNPIWRQGIVIVVLLMTLLDASGIMAIMTYAATIVSFSVDTLNPTLQTISFPAVMTIGSFFSMALIEKIGRKPLMITALILTGLSLVTLALVLLIQSQGGWVPGWIPIFAIIVALFSYGGGLFPVTYVVLSEIFNFQIRAKITGYTVTYGWFLCFLQIITFGSISELLGMHTMFFMYAGLCFIGAIACYILQPETKGKSVEEIELIFRKKFKETENL